MKKYLYIFLFMVLGLLLSQLIHSAIEIPVISLMSKQLLETGESWLADYWWLLHDMGSIVLWLAGLVFGFAMGKKYWRILYVEKRYGTPRW